MNHKELYHQWLLNFKNLDTVIDMTAGNGHDTYFLAGIARKVIAVDIQIEAIEATKERCRAFSNIEYLHQSNATLPISTPIDGIVYNLGYLPGSDKTIITTKDSTIQSLQNILPYVKRFIAIAAYRKHEGGNEEYRAVKDFIEKNFTQVEVLEYETELSPVTFLITL